MGGWRKSLGEIDQGQIEWMEVRLWGVLEGVTPQEWTVQLLSPMGAGPWSKDKAV